MSSTPQYAAPATDLPERLRLETRDLHTLSERSGVMASLIAGQLSRADYLALMRNLHAIYAALEAALNRHRAEPALHVLGMPALHREAALAGDLDALCGPSWRTTLPLAPATRAYVGRLQGLADKIPLLLVAHAYVRYLGDLHGGQVLQRLVGRHYGLSDEDGAAGTRFYDFGPTPQVLALRQQLRAALGSLPFEGPEQDAVVAEACWAFEQHQRLFAELLPGA